MELTGTMPNEAYSPLKVFHHRVRIASIMAGEHPSPVHVQIIPTNVCNQRCRFCSYRQPGYSSNETFDARQSIPFAKLCEIVADCEAMGVRAIEVTGGGEPTCHREFLPFCEAIIEAAIDLGLVSNGSNWSEAHVSVMARAKWLRFSMDAGCADTYARIRRVRSTTYETVRETIRQQHAARLADVDQLIGVGFVVTADNWTEVVQATERARDDGADNIRISAVFQNHGARYFDGFGVEAARLCREATDLATDTFHVFDLFSDRVHDLVAGRPSYEFCGCQHFVTYIGADQNVYRCCVTAYNHLGLLGSIMDRTFRDFWESEETRRSLRDFDARVCPRCMFNAKNDVIRYAVEPHPRHVNFI